MVSNKKLLTNDNNPSILNARRLYYFSLIILVFLIASSLFFNINQEFKLARDSALIEAQSNFNKDLLYRKWAANHGGVYVPVTEENPPNPYLNFISDRDIVTQFGQHLTLINPAYMQRQVFELPEGSDQIKGHITSLNPIRPENKADPWETEILQKFEKGVISYNSVEEINGKKYLRYMHVMITETSCLKCHSAQTNYVGDIRGGISVSVPLEKFDNIADIHITDLVFTHLIILLIVSLLVYFAYKRFISELNKSYQLQLKIAESESSLKIQHAEVATLNERYKLQNKELLSAKEKAEESDKLKSAFLANMSHEIRTPMNGILGFTSLLKDTVISGEKHQKYLEIIEKSGLRMLNIINDIMNISKIEAGLVTMDYKECDANDQLSNILMFFKPEAEKKGLKIRIENQNKNSLLIKTDTEKLFAILSNLVKNAVKYSNEGEIIIGYLQKDDNKLIEFYVKDNGIGIPADRQKAIFKRFVQVHANDQKIYEGMGLGLAISKAFVEMMGGTIGVESIENKGSTFFFTIPLIPVSDLVNQAEEKINTSAVERISNLRVLIAEDDEVSELLVKEILKKMTVSILHAKTGLEAVELCKSNPDLDLIMMDIRMAEMDGYEATREIRKFNTDVIIIAQTAYGMKGDREMALLSGCNDYISKPIKREELLKLLQNYFS